MEGLQTALETTLETGNEMDACEYLADDDFGCMSAPEMVQHAQELYPDRLEGALFEQGQDRHLVLLDIVSILLAGSEDKDGNATFPLAASPPTKRHCASHISE